MPKKIFKKGHTPWNKGMKHSEETKKKMSIAKKGRKLPDNHPFKIKGREPWNKGLKEPKEEYNRKRLEWANKNRGKRTFQARRSYLKIKFGITQNEFNKLLNAQNFKCKICGEKYNMSIDKVGRVRPNFHIDHNHKTGEIRGLLCSKCNLGIGYFKDSKELLIKAARYLSDDKAVNSEDFFNKGSKVIVH